MSLRDNEIGLGSALVAVALPMGELFVHVIVAVLLAILTTAISRSVGWHMDKWHGSPPRRRDREDRSRDP